MHMHAGPLIRLVGGSSYNKGRVEVNYNGQWGNTVVVQEFNLYT